VYLQRVALLDGSAPSEPDGHPPGLGLRSTGRSTDEDLAQRAISVVAFRRDDEGEVPSAKCFGFVQTYDERPRRRLWELMKSQGMQESAGDVHVGWR
jgi:hypothetical protein